MAIERDVEWEMLAPDRMKVVQLREEFFSGSPRIKLDSLSGDSLTGTPVFLRKERTQWSPELPFPSSLSEMDQYDVEVFAHNHSRPYDVIVYGPTPRRPGETWVVTDPRAFFQEPADEVSGSSTITFVGTETSDAKTFARLRVEFKFQGKPRVEGCWNRWEGQMDVRRSLDDMIDVETIGKALNEKWKEGDDISSAPNILLRTTFRTTREMLH
jgi:hypothetical protein